MKNPKLIIALIFVVLINLTNAQNIKNGQIVKNINGLNIVIDKRMEMLSVVQYLAESEMVYLDKSTTYAKNIDNYFEPFRKHKIVALYQEMEKNEFNYDAPVTTMLYLDSKFNLVKKINDTLLIKRASGEKKLNEFIKLLKDFDTKTNFDNFFKNNYTLLNKSIEMLVDSSFKNFDEINTLEKFYGYKQNSYNIYLVALFSGGYGPKMDAGNGLFDIYDIQGPWESSVNKIPFFGNEKRFKYVVWHEFSHSFVNPLVDEYYLTFKKYKTIEKPIFSMMDALQYRQWNIILYEHIVRAITSVLTYEKFGQKEAEKQLKIEKAIGFIYIDSLYAAIKHYSENKNGANFKQFFPKLIEVIEQYSNVYMEIPSIPILNDLFDEIEIIIYPTNEKNEKLNVSIKKYVESINEKFFQLPNENIIPDTLAMKRDLKDYNITCYGSYEGNLWLKTKIKNLPFKLTEDKIVSKKSINHPNLILIASWVNPDNPDKHIVIYTAQQSEQIININAVFHGPTNYVIANDKYETIEEGIYRYSNGKFDIE